jgi:CheY-like chemotaxis protein
MQEKPMTSDSGKRHLEDVSKNKISSSRILVVDDEPGVVHLMQYGLKDFFTHGEVVIAMSGHEALELLEQRPFDLLRLKSSIRKYPSS